MKEIFENKTKLYLFTLVLFLFSSIIIKIIPNNVGNIVTYFIFPIYFFVLTILYLKKNKINWDMPIIFTLLYLLVGYICIEKLMSPLKVIIAYLASIIPLLSIKIFYKIKNKKLEVEKIEEKDEEEKKIISFFLPLISIIVLEFYYTICTFDIARISLRIFPAIISIILIYCIYFILLAIFRRTDRAIIFFGIFFLIIYIINEGRIYYTSDTLLITDVLFLQNAGEVAGFAGVTFINCIKFIFFATILAIVILTYLFKIAKRNNIKVKNIKNSLIRCAISIIVLVLLFMPKGNVDKFIVNNIYNINDGKDNAITASNTRYFYKYGVLSGLYGKLIESRRFVPDDYDENELKGILENAPKNNGTWKQPNVIVIFSESFWDVSKLEKIKFDKDVTPNYHMLKEKEIAIEMISPAYGGISSNVEFEILTGGSLNFFSKGYTPYMQLFHKGISDNNPNFIKELKNNGYKTKILNSSSANMFNCDFIYDIYGVDERNHLYDEIDLNGEYVTDSYLTDQIIEYFNNKDKDEKTFFFTITMGGHMPYFEERYEKYDVNIIESPYEDDVNEVVHSYAEGMYLADKELGRLYDYINTLDEDTIVIFFGDHLPHLSTPDGKDALFKTNFLSYDYDLESVYRQFNTTALILSNYDIEYDGTKYLSPDLLLTYVFNNMDLELSPFYRWLYQTKDTLPSSNYVVSQDKDGKIYYTLALTDEMKKTYELREKMQYMLFK